MPFRNALLTCLGAINHARKTALASIFTALKWRREYLETNNKPTCCDECDSLHLGALIRLMKSHNLNLEYPYIGLSVEAAEQRVSSFKQPRSIHPTTTASAPITLCHRPSEAKANSRLLGEGTMQEIENAISVLQGLELNWFWTLVCFYVQKEYHFFSERGGNKRKSLWSFYFHTNGTWDFFILWIPIIWPRTHRVSYSIWRCDGQKGLLRLPFSRVLFRLRQHPTNQMASNYHTWMSNSTCWIFKISNSILQGCQGLWPRRDCDIFDVFSM